MFKTIINFLKLPQFWTGLSAALVAFGLTGPALEFITTEGQTLALLFGILSQLFGFSMAQRMSRIYNDYTLRVENNMLRQGLTVAQVDDIIDDAQSI